MPVPPEVVFDYRLDFASNLSAYNKNVREVLQLEGLEPGRGSKYRVRVRLAPGLMVSSTLTVTEADRPKRICDTAESVIGSARETLIFEPTMVAQGGSGTSVSFLLETDPKNLLGRLVDRVLMALARRQVRLELESMRCHLEARAG